MHKLLFDHQHALEEDDLGGYAVELGLDVARLDSDGRGEAALQRVRRDGGSRVASDEMRGTPTS